MKFHSHLTLESGLQQIPLDFYLVMGGLQSGVLLQIYEMNKHLIRANQKISLFPREIFNFVANYQKLKYLDLEILPWCLLRIVAQVPELPFSSRGWATWLEPLSY